MNRVVDPDTRARRQIRVGLLADAGASVTEIVAEVGYTRATVIRDLEDMGMRTRPGRGRPRKAIVVPDRYCTGSQQAPARRRRDRGTCTVCQETHTIRKDGTISRHQTRRAA